MHFPAAASVSRQTRAPLYRGDIHTKFAPSHRLSDLFCHRKRFPLRLPPARNKCLAASLSSSLASLPFPLHFQSANLCSLHLILARLMIPLSGSPVCIAVGFVRLCSTSSTSPSLPSPVVDDATTLIPPSPLSPSRCSLSRRAPPTRDVQVIITSPGFPRKRILVLRLFIPCATRRSFQLFRSFDVPRVVFPRQTPRGNSFSAAGVLDRGGL